MPFRFPPLTPTVKKLLIVLAGAFVLSAVLENVGGLPVFAWLSLDLRLDPDGSYLNFIWQPFTHALVWPPVPESLLYAGFSLLFVYLTLAPFDHAFGARRTWELVICGTVAGAIAAVLLALALNLAGVVLSPEAYFLSGPGSMIFAAFGAFPVLMRGGEIYFMFIVRMKAWHTVLVGLGLSALAAVLAKNPHVFAMDAGALGAGVAYATWLTRPRPAKKAPAKKRRTSGPELRVLRGGASSDANNDDDQPRWLN